MAMLHRARSMRREKTQSRVVGGRGRYVDNGGGDGHVVHVRVLVQYSVPVVTGLDIGRKQARIPPGIKVGEKGH